MNEFWLPVDGYNGLYLISNTGFVKSTDRYSKMRWNAQCLHKGKILKGNLDAAGYRIAYLYVNGAKKHFYIHRLVASHFIPNPEGKEQVNHINSIRHDNRVENLEWCTPKENIQHAWRVGRAKVTDKWRESSRMTGKNNKGTARVVK